MDSRLRQAQLRRLNNVRFKTTMHNCVAFKVMQSRGWTEVFDTDYDWDIFWADVHSLGVESNFDHSKLQDHQKLNHFPRHVELTRKDLMVKNLKRARKALEKEGRGYEYDFFPQTYVLPLEHGLFVEEFRRNPGITWIMKPCGRAQGRGIFLLDRLSQVSGWRKDREDKEKPEVYVVSRYLERPLLVGGKKFDLRIYALVVSFMPLKVYLHRGGFCRFSSGRYSLDKDNMKNLYMHLTNVAIQKKGENFEQTTGMKWPIRNLKLYLMTKFGPAAAHSLFGNIQTVVLRSLLAVQRVITQDKHCFELYGYDVLIDEDLKPWLIEVNASPSLVTDTPADHKLKFDMVDDALTLVDVEGKLEGSLPASYGGFDLVWDGSGPVPVHPSLPSMLGTDIPEGRKNRRLPKPAAP
ncbi:hypothetical protein WJX72_007153 [[Myrmecia] bisecta]|uniref:Tubulin--tyrosine ligase-like protein 9 n=1 Tax=[Myrmecia] bisecta TaxID=41462 RepID=A0AAW1PJD3_9CHLO